MTEPVTITEPGVYRGLDEETYHRDPWPGGSLSVSGAKRLLLAPAIFHYERANPRLPSAAMTAGHVAHTLVLGTGAPIVVVLADDWRTKRAQTIRDEAKAAGMAPVLKDQYLELQAMADALLAHPWARALFEVDSFESEVSMFWPDPEFGITLRSRLDLLPAFNGQGRLVIPDYKTAISADPVSVEKAVANFGYDMQADQYSDGAVQLGLADEVAFVFVFQEKTRPYLVTVGQLDAQALRIGRQRNREARALYAACTAAGEWPGYANQELITIGAPYWHAKQYDPDFR